MQNSPGSYNEEQQEKENAYSKCEGKNLRLYKKQERHAYSKCEGKNLRLYKKQERQREFSFRFCYNSDRDYEVACF